MNAHDRSGITFYRATERRSPTTSALSIIEWLGGNECHDLDDAALVGELGRRLPLAGLLLDRLTLHFRTLHPALAGRTIAWAPDEPIEIYESGHSTAASTTFRENPIAQVVDAGECLVVRASDPSYSNWNGIDLFKGRALREFVIAPLSGGEGPVSIAVFGTVRGTGFSPIERALLERILPVLRTACLLRALRQLELPVLDGFTGRRTAERMLASRLLGYKTETTEAALMLVKSETGVGDLEPAQMEATIEKTTSVISGYGGIVLSIDDDLTLAMFPQEAKVACAAAMKAAEHIAGTFKDDGFSSGVFLHYGKLTYGQITTPFGPRLAMSGRDFHHLKKLGRVAAEGVTLSQHFSELIGTSGSTGPDRCGA